MSVHCWRPSPHTLVGTYDIAPLPPERSHLNQESATPLFLLQQTASAGSTSCLSPTVTQFQLRGCSFPLSQSRALSTCLKGLAPPQPGLRQNSGSLFLRQVWNGARIGLRNGTALSLMSAVIAWISNSNNRGSPITREGRTSVFRRSFLGC